MNVEEYMNKTNASEMYGKHKYFPGDLLYNDPWYYHIVIGVKGDGKSFWKLINMLKIWKRGKHTVELIQTKEKIKEIMRFQDYFDRLYAPGDEEDILDVAGELDNEEINNMVDNMEYRDSSIWLDGRLVVKFVPLLGMDKNKDLVGATTEWIVEDETFKDRYEKNTAYAFMLILDTIFRKRSDIKVTQLGNAISLNHPMFVAFGCYELDKDKVITFHHGAYTDKPIVKIWNWKRPIEDIEKSYGDSPLWDLYQETGYGDFAFKNEFKNDNLDNIINIDDSILNKNGELQHTFVAQDIIVDCWFINKDKNNTGRPLWYYKVNREKSKSDVKYALNQEDADDKTIYRPSMATDMANKLQRNVMWYDSVITKQSIWNTLKKFF